MSLLTIVMILIVAGAITAFTILRSSDDIDSASNLMLSIFIALILAMILSQKTITTVDEDGVTVRRRFSFNYGWPFEDITHAEPQSYKAATKEYGRGALFFSAMHILHDAGVLIHLSNDKLTFISSKRATELVNVINTGRVDFERRKYE